MSDIPVGGKGLIIGSYENFHLIGMEVTIKEHLNPYESFLHEEIGVRYTLNEPSYVVSFSEPQTIFCNGEIKGKTDYAVLFRRRVIPLDGDFTDEEEVEDALLSLQN